MADLILIVLDRSRPLTADDREVMAVTVGRPRVIVVNKCDLPAAWHSTGVAPDALVAISVVTGAGLDDLVAAVARALSGEETRDRPAITNLRHAMLLERARAALLQATSALEGSISEEFPLLDLQEAGHALQEITGRRTTDDLLQHIFKNFCIGK